jgi:leucyl aminopeptidase (aminopeptidase T)
MAAFMEAFQPWYDKVREKKIRSVELMVGQVTKPRAKAYGYNYARWKRNVENSSNVDYKKMAQIGKKVATRLETGKQVEVTTNTGTNLKLEIGTHPVHIEDGIIDEADQEKGFIFTSIPTGYVTTAPLPSSAEGTVYFDLPSAFMGRLLKGLKWEFQAGRVVKSSADKYPEAFSKLYDNATGDKDVIAGLSVGINPESKPMGYTTDWLGLGIVSVGIGENRYIGGNNNSDFQFQGSLAKATVKVDGKPLVEKGRLAL